MPLDAADPREPERDYPITPHEAETLARALLRPVVHKLLNALPLAPTAAYLAVLDDPAVEGRIVEVIAGLIIGLLDERRP